MVVAVAAVGIFEMVMLVLKQVPKILDDAYNNVIVCICITLFEQILCKIRARLLQIAATFVAVSAQKANAYAHQDTPEMVPLVGLRVIYPSIIMTTTCLRIFLFSDDI